MSQGTDFFDGIFEERLSELHTAMPARVEKYDPVSMKAEVVPLFKRKFIGQDAASLPKIVEAPVAAFRAGGFVIRPPYRKGDMVLLVFSERSLDTVIGTGQEADPAHSRKHALDDAIVVGGLMPFTTQLPGDHASDMVIAKEDFTSKVVLTETGDVVIESSGSTYLGEGATEGVPLGTSLREWLDSHTHGGGATPDVASPAPSGKVFVK